MLLADMKQMFRFAHTRELITSNPLDAVSKKEAGGSDVERNRTYIGNGRYRYIINDTLMERACVIGQLRVRHWPANEESIKGRQRLNKLTTAYVNSLKQMKLPANPDCT